MGSNLALRWHFRPSLGTAVKTTHSCVSMTFCPPFLNPNVCRESVSCSKVSPRLAWKKIIVLFKHLVDMSDNFFFQTFEVSKGFEMSSIFWMTPSGLLNHINASISIALLHEHYSVSPIYRGRVYRGIGYIAVACWTPFFWRPRARYFLRNRGNTFDPIRGRQFFAKSAHRDSLCSRFAGDNFSQNQLWPTCQCGLEHMLCDGQPSSAEHWHLHCIAE